MASEQDHYAVLDLPRTATADEIKRRYRSLMRRTHPDANANDPKATRSAARINLAYETLGDTARRRAYDERTRGAPKRSRRVYEHWADQDGWEDIVAEHVPARRPAHVHSAEPIVEPDEIEVDLSELRLTPRVRRRIAITNRCTDCMLRGDVSTSEPWVWGPVGRFVVGPGERVEFDIEVVGSKIRFPGLSRVLFVANGWTGIVPVRITGFETKRRRVVPLTDAQYVPPRGPRAARGRIR